MIVWALRESLTPADSRREEETLRRFFFACLSCVQYLQTPATRQRNKSEDAATTHIAHTTFHIFYRY